MISRMKMTRVAAYRSLRSFSSTVKINPAVLNIPGSGIRDIMTRATELDRESPQNPVIRLEVGQPNFRTPEFIVDATIQALRDGHTTYNPNNGVLTLRETIAEKYSSDGYATRTDQVVVTVGSSLSLFSLLVTLLQPGDHCLLPLPGFPNYQAAVAMVGGHCVPYLCAPEDGYLPTLATIQQQATVTTKCIILCNPGNPTGATYPTELLCSIVQWAHSKGIFVISDEIYSDIVFDAPHTCAAALEGDSKVDPTLLAIVSGVSKGYAMTGYRVGWTRCSPALAAQLTKIQEPLVSCASPFNQLAAAVAIRDGASVVEDMRQRYHNRRDIALDILKQRGRASAYIPGGAFYLPVDISSSGLESKEFALKLLYEKRCAIAPGIAFDTTDPTSAVVDEEQRQQYQRILNRFCRVSLANSEENVSKGMSLICDLLDETHNQ